MKIIDDRSGEYKYKLEHKLFGNVYFSMSWFVILAAIEYFIAWPIRNIILVCWVYGMDGYMDKKISVLSEKPVKFSNGELAPVVPDMVTGLLSFVVVVFGLTFFLIGILRIYENISNKTANQSLKGRM